MKRTVALCLALAFCMFSRAQGTPAGGPQLHLICVPHGKATPTFQVEFRNSGHHDLMLRMGMIVNSSKQYPRALTFALTDAHGKTLQLEPAEPGYVAGRVDPFLVPLPAGATFTLPIDLADYASPRQEVWSFALQPGQYSMTATFTGVGLAGRGDVDSAAMAPWTGSVTSNAVAFTVAIR